MSSTLSLVFRSHAITSGILVAVSTGAYAQTSAQAPNADAGLATVTVTSSADASAQGLPKAYAGGQVARGGRVGILGNQDVMSTPFSTTSYTNELIENQQARSVADVLLNDPGIRTARGFGNFQESYFMRGFLLSSDSLANNGLYGLLPRQYISAELFERVEVLRGATAFLNGATPAGDAVGGSINLLPKRAPNEPLSKATIGFASGGQYYAAGDVARRFGPDNSTGVRVNIARRKGETGVHSEDVDLTVASIGLDWRNANARLSADIGYQDHKLSRTRTNVALGPTATHVPAVPDSRANWSQPWSFSNERDTFGTVRGEYDFSADITGWGAVGARRNYESNSLANLTVDDANTGAGSTYRFDNTGRDKVVTGELGVRARARTGTVGHQIVATVAAYKADRDNAYGFSTFNGLATNLYTPVNYAQPALAFTGNTLSSPSLNRTVKLTSFAVGDTLSLLNDSVLITLGLRHQKLEQDNYSYADATTPSTLSSNYSQGRTSQLASAVYKFRPDLSVYGNYVEGISPGDTAPATASNRGTQLAPFISRQKEVGLKYDGGRIGASLALFTTNKPRAFVVPQGEFAAAGEDRHRGMEVNVFGEVMRGLRVLGGATLLQAEQQSTGSASTDGKRVIGVASRQANLGVEYDVPVVRGLTLDARMLATGGSFVDPANTLSVPGWARYDIGARYLMSVSGKLVTLRARVDNVANRNYWASSGGFAGSGYLVMGTPRVVTLSASMEL